MSQNTCGECTLCCKLLDVLELNKGMNVWCEHCDPGVGCRIYDSKPKSCTDFHCVYLNSDLSVNFRPDKMHVVMWEVDKDITNMAFRQKPDELFPRADVVIQEDPKYYALGMSRHHPRVQDLIGLFKKRGWAICIINGFERIEI